MVLLGGSLWTRSAIVSSGAKQRVRKSAAALVPFPVLWCGMFHLEYRLDQEAFRVAVVSAKRQHFADDTTAWLTFGMNDNINGFPDLRLGVGEGGLRVVAHDQIGEAGESFGCRVGVDRRERSRVAGIEGIEQRAGLDAAHFAHDDPVRSPAESGL